MLEVMMVIADVVAACAAIAITIFGVALAMFALLCANEYIYSKFIEDDEDEKEI